VSAVDAYVVVIEIPRGSRNKYEQDPETGEIWLDRMLFSSVHYPTEYGHFPETLAEDGDELDAMVLLEESTFPGCRIKARPVGVLQMHDERGRDDKVLCVVATDPRVAHIRSIEDVDPSVLGEIAHFFEVYKALEPDKTTDVGDWSGVDEALRLVEEARRRHASHIA
jgi:inorganic pyrophosphatase